MNIYVRAHPDRASEMLQYNHIIEIAPSSFNWEQVYRYNREFRLHMSAHPHRNWGIILQQAWSLYLKSGEGISANAPAMQGKNHNNNSQSDRKKIGYRYNQGKCAYRFNCKFDHHCGICNKWGHGAHSCRKMGMDRGRDRDRNKDDHRNNHHFDRETGEKYARRDAKHK